MVDEQAQACGEESTLRAVIRQACITDDELFAARPLWSEINGHQVTKQIATDAVKATPGIVVPDAKRVYDALQNSSSTALGLTEERSGTELLGLDTGLRWCHSDIQLADGVTRDGKWSWTRRLRRQRNERRWE